MVKAMVEVEVGDDIYSINRIGPQGGTEEDNIRTALLILRDSYVELKAALERRLPPEAVVQTAIGGVGGAR